ncbi:MAG: sialate O-acetylesterase [Armatimonadota bacterium]|nr:sialate O-acetylesterase [Armatimonadota bacterium]
MTLQDNQVLQRDADDKARVTLDTGETLELTTGGPYQVGGAKNVLVGDLWILAGQSNMEGVGDMVDVEPPSPRVHSYQSREQWAQAEEPLHWLGESPHLVHHKLWGREAVPDAPDPRDPSRNKGAGLGLAFAKSLSSGAPIGLIPSAHGGTSMAQWDPALKGEGSGSLYGATLSRVQSVGGKVAGILWYQGESDANPSDLALYQERMTKLVQSFRQDLGQPDLPFYIVQLGRFAYPANADANAGWNGVREAQRVWAASTPQAAMTSAIDLELDDAIHIGTQGLKRLGHRLAALASGRPALDFARVEREADGFRLRVHFSGVNGGLTAKSRPAGFSLRDADGNELVSLYKITLEGDGAVLHLSQGEFPLPSGASLWYGWGLDPFCNITDAEDAPVPAFGPVPVA